MSGLLGGPVLYTGPSLCKVHAHLHLTDREFDAFFAISRQALADANVSTEFRIIVMDVLERQAGPILGKDEWAPWLLHASTECRTRMHRNRFFFFTRAESKRHPALQAPVPESPTPLEANQRTEREARRSALMPLRSNHKHPFPRNTPRTASPAHAELAHAAAAPPMSAPTTPQLSTSCPPRYKPATPDHGRSHVWLARNLAGTHRKPYADP